MHAKSDDVVRLAVCALALSLAVTELTACRPAPAAALGPEAGAKPRTALTGAIEGRKLEVSSAVFVWQDKANDMALVLSDAPDLCDALRAGAWPRSSRVLLVILKLETPENRDGPFRAGRYPLRDKSVPERPPQDVKEATFLDFDGSCMPLLQKSASAGSVTLTTPAVAIGGEAAGKLAFSFGEGSSLGGRFVATYCPAEEEPHGCR